MISLHLSPCSWQTHLNIFNQWPSQSTKEGIARILIRVDPSRIVTTSWCLPSISQVTTHFFRCLSQITQAQAAVVSGTSKTRSLQGEAEQTTLDIKRDSIQSSKGRWAAKRVKVMMKKMTARVTPHRIIAATKSWRARKVVTERRSSSHIRWIKHRRL